MSEKDLSKYLVSQITIPIYSNKPKNKKFFNFLQNNTNSDESWLTCHKDIGALQVFENKLTIDSKKCIGCLACLITNNKISMLDQHVKQTLLDLFFQNPQNILSSVYTKNLFSGKIISLPIYTDFGRKFNSLEDFSSVNEVEHIALWALSILKFLSSSKEARIGREIEILQTENPRDGRLDVCVISDSTILVVETKTDFNSMLNENRYREQMPNYIAECNKMIFEYETKTKIKTKWLPVLLIGGKETDLLPPTHPDCTSCVGDKSMKFYGELVKNKIKFISANMLWCLALNAIISEKKICWDLLFQQSLSDENAFGLLTCGVIVKNKNEFVVKPISQEQKSSATTYL